MKRESLAPPEYIGFRRFPAVPGLDVIDAHSSPRQWRDVGTGFAVTFVRTWRGDVFYRNRRHDVAPGIAFCNQPAEALIATPHAGTAGSFNVLVVAPELMKEWVFDHQAQRLRPQWRGITLPISPQLSAKFARFLDVFRPEESPLALQSATAVMAHEMIGELVSGAADVAVGGEALRGVARMRERLKDEDLESDLDTLAREAGLSRFQALRAFKRRYGLPPHAYQLCLRVGRARAMLLRGAAATEVAAHCGFVDQSHFNRHFKRIVGATPTQFAAMRSNAAYGIYDPA